MFQIVDAVAELDKIQIHNTRGFGRSSVKHRFADVFASRVATGSTGREEL